MVADVPAFGWRRMHLDARGRIPGRHDDGREIALGGLGEAADDGTLGSASVSAARGSGPSRTSVTAVTPTTSIRCPDWVTRRLGDVRRTATPSGIERLAVTRTMASATVVRIEVRVAPGIDRVDLQVEVSNPAADHRLRLCFPTGAPVD